MQNASLAAFLHLEGSPFAIPLDASHYHWQQQIDHRGRPRSKVRAGSWRFATSLLDQASYQHLLELMLSPTTVVEARATYGRADGQGTFVTVWGRHCTVSHVFSHFDARGIHGREAGWTLYFTLAAEEMGREAGTAGAFVMPAAGSYAVTPPASVAGPVAPDAHAAAWAAAKAQALAPARKAGLYAAYVAAKKRQKAIPRSEKDWWGQQGKRGGARLTVEGCLGEYQADKLFAAQGHEKLNHGGQLCGVLDLPRGRGLDGVWRNAAPPPEYLITETKYTTTSGKAVALSNGGQMSDPWVLASNRLTNALGRDKGEKMRKAMENNQVGKRLLHVDSDGKLHEYEIDAKGKITPLKK